MKHGMVRLDNVWGVGGGIKPVKYLVSHISSWFHQRFGFVYIGYGSNPIMIRIQSDRDRV